MTKNTRGVSPLVRSGFHLQPASDQSSLKVLQFVEKQLAQFNPSQTLSSSPNCKTNTVQMLDHCMIHSTHSASLFSCVRAACLTLPFPLSSSVFSKAAVFKLFKSPVLMCDNCTTLRSRVPRRTPEGCSLFQNQISVGASEVSKGSLAVTHIYFDISYFIQSIVMINTVNHCDFDRESPFHMWMWLPKLCRVFVSVFPAWKTFKFWWGLHCYNERNSLNNSGLNNDVLIIWNTSDETLCSRNQQIYFYDWLHCSTL